MEKNVREWLNIVGAWGDPPCYPNPLSVRELARARRDGVRLVVVVDGENRHNVVAAKDWGVRSAPIDAGTAAELIEKEIADGPLPVSELPCPPPEPPDGEWAKILARAQKIDGLAGVAERLSSELTALRALVEVSDKPAK